MEEENQNQTENLNTPSYNPNRPQNSNPNHEDTKKVADTVAKGAAEYLAPGLGAKAYDAVKKTPVVGNTINQALNKTAEIADRNPMVKNASQKLNESGATDLANKGIDALSGNPNGMPNEPLNNNVSPTPAHNQMANNHQNASNNYHSPNLNKGQPISNLLDAVTKFRHNNLINSSIRESQNENVETENTEEETSENLTSGNKDTTSTPNYIDNSNIKTNNSNETNSKKEDGAEGLMKVSISSWLKKNAIIIAPIGGIILLIFFIIFIIIGGSDDLNQNMTGYYDANCNFNETNVEIKSCTTDEIIHKITIKDYVIGSIYSLTKDNNYSDETLKAAMIVLKTNALANGNYNSSSKLITLQECTENYETVTGNSKSKLEELYSEIENYLYLSSSYTSTISMLNTYNVLKFDTDTLTYFDSLAKNNYDYNRILETTYQDSNNEEEIVISRETLFLGDSRTQGLINAGLIPNNSIYGVGYGYNWFIGNGTFSSSYTNAVNGGINALNDLMAPNASYNIVIWLGVNDYSMNNASTYFNKYRELATSTWQNHVLYIVSVGPVLDSRAQYVQNSGINAFNNELKSLIQNSNLTNLKYIDLNLTESSIKNYDSEGLHYGAQDYQNIYNIISSNLSDTLSKSYSLYDLKNYCTYYNLTKNDAYWWPVGSINATSGNIYGGAPAAIAITSYFGPRIDPFTGEQVAGHGALDIGAPRNTPVIATKSGTVTYINTGCVEGNLSCGGSYGNHIMIDHGDGVVSLYAHLTQVEVKVGDNVTQGELIGYSGSTGRSTGPHLHFEIRLQGTKVDPLTYVDPENPRPTNSLNGFSPASGTDNQNQICHTLLNNGLSKNATIGIMISMYAESGFIPNNLQNSYETSLHFTDETYTAAVDAGTYQNFIHDSAGYGLSQWTFYTRKEELYNFAKQKNKSIGDLNMQLEFFYNELQSPTFASLNKYLLGNHSASEMGTYYCKHYENPAGSCEARTALYLERFTNYVNNDCN